MKSFWVEFSRAEAHSMAEIHRVEVSFCEGFHCLLFFFAICFIVFVIIFAGTAEEGSFERRYWLMSYVAHSD
jgi:hypothetical protein